MKPLYLLTHIWSEFETHYETLGIYENRDLAEKAIQEYRNSNHLHISDYEEFDIDEIKLNRFVWEK